MGGNQGYGVDCSGFTQAVVRIFGESLKRNSGQQALQGSSVGLDNIQTGDLATFGVKNGERVSHLGFIVKDGDETSLIHSKQKVKRQLVNDDLMYPESAEFAELKGLH